MAALEFFGFRSQVGDEKNRSVPMSMAHSLPISLGFICFHFPSGAVFHNYLFIQWKLEHIYIHTHTHTHHRQKRWARARRNKLIVHTFIIFKFLERVNEFPLSLIFVFVFLFLFPFIFLPISLFGICIKSDDAEEMIPIHCTIRRDNPAFSGDPTDQIFLSFRHH